MAAEIGWLVIAAIALYLIVVTAFMTVVSLMFTGGLRSEIAVPAILTAAFIYAAWRFTPFAVVMN